MIEFSTLENTNIEDIVEAFNKSFSDYFVPLNLNSEQFQVKMETENISLRYSVGAFDHNLLAGFILHFYDDKNNIKKVYNGGRGVIPSYRGKSLTKRMYNFIIPQLLLDKVDQIVLDVLVQNTQAIVSYKKVGSTTDLYELFISGSALLIRLRILATPHPAGKQLVVQQPVLYSASQPVSIIFYGVVFVFSIKNQPVAQPLTVMLAVTLNKYKINFMAIATLDKTEIFTETGEAVSQLIDLMSSVDENKINTIPYEGSWTAPQLLRHVTKSMNGMDKAMLMDAKPAERNPGERIEELKKVFLDFSKKLNSPDFIVPEEGVYERQPAIDQLTKSFNRFKENANNANLHDLVEGLPLGPITKLEIIHFVLFHTQRHLQQMKKICNALKDK